MNVWDIDEGVCIMSSKNNEFPLYCVKYNINGDKFAISSKDKNIKL